MLRGWHKRRQTTACRDKKDSAQHLNESHGAHTKESSMYTPGRQDLWGGFKKPDRLCGPWILGSGRRSGAETGDVPINISKIILQVFRLVIDHHY